MDLFFGPHEWLEEGPLQNQSEYVKYIYILSSSFNDAQKCLLLNASHTLWSGWGEKLYQHQR